MYNNLKENPRTLEKIDNLISRCYNIRLKTPVFKKKITRHIKKQESIAHSKEQNLSTEAIPAEAQILDKDFKTTILKMFKVLKEQITNIVN